MGDGLYSHVCGIHGLLVFHPLGVLSILGCVEHKVCKAVAVPYLEKKLIPENCFLLRQ